MPTSIEVPDGNDLTQGRKADSAATDSTSSWSLIALLKGLYAKLAGTLTVNLLNTSTPVRTAITVGVTSTAVLTAPALANAKFLLIINDSTNVMYLDLSGNPAVLNAGVRLNANGGAILLDRYIPNAAIAAIATAAGSNLLVEVG